MKEQSEMATLQESLHQSETIPSPHDDHHIEIKHAKRENGWLSHTAQSPLNHLSCPSFQVIY